MSDNIFDAEKEAERLDLKDDDIAPGSNPQGLSVREIKDRCRDIRMSPGMI